MSTRSVFTFRDADSAFHVYMHSDGYPSGAAKALSYAIGFAWSLPRYEADDFAAGFVAGNKARHWLQEPLCDFLESLTVMGRPKDYASKTVRLAISIPNAAFGPAPIDKGGNIRLLPSGSVYEVSPGDIEYRYEITPGNEPGTLRVVAFAMKGGWWDHPGLDNEEMIIHCELSDFAAKAEEYDKARRAA